MPITKTTIAGGKFAVNNSRYFDGWRFINPGEITSIPSQPEARLIERSDNALNSVGLEINFTYKWYGIWHEKSKMIGWSPPAGGDTQIQNATPLILGLAP